MKNLLVMRHAKSSWNHPELSDHDRPLNKRGKLAAPRMGRLLKDQNLPPKQIVSSTAKRARKTAELIAETIGLEGALEVSFELYHAGPENYFRVLSELYYEDEPVLVIGHNPGLEGFLESLVGSYERLPTAAIAHVTVDIQHWWQFDKHATCTLVNIWRPKELE